MLVNKTHDRRGYLHEKHVKLYARTIPKEALVVKEIGTSLHLAAPGGKVLCISLSSDLDA